VFLQKSVAMLATSSPELAFKFYLEIAVATDLLAFSVRSNNKNSTTEFSGIAYDFMTQAFLVYEDEISESKAQVRSITSIVGSLLSCRTFERTDYEALITKTAQYAAKLLKKPDQCRMVCLVSRLFYSVNEVCFRGQAADAIVSYLTPFTSICTGYQCLP
jgi:vacuolar protein sorting-associated protein 35